jgi:hypothetical protein
VETSLERDEFANVLLISPAAIGQILQPQMSWNAMHVNILNMCFKTTRMEHHAVVIHQRLPLLNVI